MTVSRGVRVSEEQFGRIWDVFQDATHGKPLKAKIQLNEVLVALLELGTQTYTRLPAEMRRGLFKKRKYQSQQDFRVQLEARVSRLAEKFKLDERLALAIPSTIKTELRMQKQRTGVSMSAQVRERLKEPA